MSQTNRWKGNWRNKMADKQSFKPQVMVLQIRLGLCSSQLQCWRIIPGRDASGKQSSLVVHRIWFVEGGMMTPFWITFDGPCVTTLTDTSRKSAGPFVFFFFPKIFWQSEGTSNIFWQSCPELGNPDIDKVNKQRKPNSTKPKRIKPKWSYKPCGVSSITTRFFPRYNFVAPLQRRDSSTSGNKKNITDDFFLIHRCGVWINVLKADQTRSSPILQRQFAKRTKLLEFLPKTQGGGHRGVAISDAANMGVKREK